MADKKEQGLKTTDKGKYVPPSERAPYNPDNKFKSKAQFIADEKERKEQELKVKEYAAGIKKEAAEKKETPKSEAPKEEKPKSRGRPKKIE
jgi:hypothetical protein